MNLENAKQQKELWLKSSEYHTKNKDFIMANACKKNAESYDEIIKNLKP